MCLMLISFAWWFWKILKTVVHSGNGKEQWSTKSWIPEKGLNLNTLWHLDECPMGMKGWNGKQAQAVSLGSCLRKRPGVLCSETQWKWIDEQTIARVSSWLICAAPSIPKLFGSEPSFFCSVLINSGYDKWPCWQLTTVKIKSLSGSLPSSKKQRKPCPQPSCSGIFSHNLSGDAWMWQCMRPCVYSAEYCELLGRKHQPLLKRDPCK